MLIDSNKLKSDFDIARFDTSYGCSFKVIDSQPEAVNLDNILSQLQDKRCEILNDTEYPNEIINYFLDYVDELIGIVEKRGLR